MVIRFTCECGQPITARADYAGRRVQCVACKKVLTVPGQRRGTTLAPRTAPKTVLRGPAEEEPAQTMPPHPAVEPPAAPPAAATPRPAVASAPVVPTGATLRRPPVGTPATMLFRNVSSVRFRCACGGEYQAQPEHAGQPALCPRCNDVLFIPSAAAVARAGGQPVLASRDRRGQYRPRAGRWAQLARLCMGLVLLGLLAAGSYGAWAFYFRDIAQRSDRQKETALGLVPDDVIGFRCLRPNVALKSKLPEKVKHLLTDVRSVSSLFVPEFDQELFLQLDRSVRLLSGGVETFVIVGLEGPGGWWAVETTDPVRKEDLKQRLGFEANPRPGEKYFRTRRMPKRALYFVHDRLFVLATTESAMRTFLHSLDAKKTRDPQGRFQRALVQVDPSTYFVGALSLPPDLSIPPLEMPSGSETILKALSKVQANGSVVWEVRESKIVLHLDLDMSNSRNKGSPHTTIHFDLTLDPERLTESFR